MGVDDPYFDKAGAECQVLRTGIGVDEKMPTETAGSRIARGGRGGGITPRFCKRVCLPFGVGFGRPVYHTRGMLQYIWN